MNLNLNGYQLRPEYQLPAHEAAINHLRNYDGPALLDISVGGGKTVLIGAVCAHAVSVGAKVLVLSRQGEIVEQDSLEAYAMGVKNSRFSASLGQKSTFYPVVMGTEKTVANYLDSRFVHSDFVPHVILIDECHHLDHIDIISDEPTTSYSKIINHFLKLNPKVKIIGYTGTPFRGKIDVIGNFWGKCLNQVSSMQLIELGYLVPPVFGFGDDAHLYDLQEFKPEGGEGAHDFTRSEMAAMQRKITKDVSKTQFIMEEVIERTRDRLGVLITCAGKKHCQQVADCLPPDSWGIVTDDISTKARKKILDDAKSGKIKYVIQVGCLSTGINIPRWQVCVILRKIGSLTLLVQLIGRALRTLNKKQIESGLTKNDALILDYAETMESMGDIYDDPILNKALAQKAQDDGEFLECPACETKNSKHAIRCIGGGLNRCDYYFKFRECKICKAHNAPSARECRECQSTLIDPNAALINKAYTEADFKPVLSVKYEKTKAGDGICVEYRLDATYFKDGIEHPEVAREYFKPFSKEAHNRGKWSAFITAHINGERFRQSVYRMRTLDQIIQNKAMFDVPKMITHRVNDKGFSIINRKEFLSGRIAE